MKYKIDQQTFDNAIEYLKILMQIHSTTDVDTSELIMDTVDKLHLKMKKILDSLIVEGE